MRNEAAIYVDGKRLIVFSDIAFHSSQVPEYTWASLPPGKYRIAIVPLDPQWHRQVAAHSALDVEAGQSYFVEVAWQPKPDPSFIEAITNSLTEPILGPRAYEGPGLIYLQELKARDIITRAMFVDATK